MSSCKNDLGTFFQELKENVKQTDESLHSFMGYTVEYYELKVFKFLMHIMEHILKWIIIGVLAFLALLLFSVAVAYALGLFFDNMAYGFAIVGFFYVILMVLYVLFRNKWNGSLIRKFSIYFFE